MGIHNMELMEEVDKSIVDIMIASGIAFIVSCSPSYKENHK
jgi:hypothetical protein